ncbi:unnamed protein product [Absidia cylindrospora]
MTTDQLSTASSSTVKESLVQEDFSDTKHNEIATDKTGTEVPSKEDAPQVFVGNLSLRTREQGLVSLFGPFGQLLDIQIIMIRRYDKRRSARYGFITFATMEQVLTAIKNLDKKELDGREIQVQVARSKPRITANTDPEISTDSANVKSDTDRRPSKHPNGRALSHVRNNKSEVAQGENGTSKKNSTTQLNGGSVISEEIVTSRAVHNKKPIAEPSQTTIFVANLPYSATDNTLMDVFKNYKVVSVRVARLRNGQSRGYGFVDLSSQHERDMALESIQHVELQGRLIYTKVARSQMNISRTTVGGADSSETIRQVTASSDPVKERDLSVNTCT